MIKVFGVPFESSVSLRKALGLYGIKWCERADITELLSCAFPMFAKAEHTRNMNRFKETGSFIAKPESLTAIYANYRVEYGLIGIFDETGSKKNYLSYKTLDEKQYYKEMTAPPRKKVDTILQEETSKEMSLKIQDHNGNVYDSMAEMAKKYNLPYKVLWSRLNVHKWPIEKALTTPYEANDKTVKRQYTCHSNSSIQIFSQTFDKVEVLHALGFKDDFINVSSKEITAPVLEKIVQHELKTTDIVPMLTKLINAFKDKELFTHFNLDEGMAARKAFREELLQETFNAD